MDQAAHNKIVSFIWGIADDVLRDLFVRGKYRDVILPMCVLRRLDAVLEQTKQAVLDTKKMLDGAGITEQRAALCAASGQAFYNTSPFRLRDLKSRGNQQQLKADFEAYLDGFSANVQDILNNFEFRNILPRLSKADALGTLIAKFLDPEINLSPNPVLNGDGTVKHPAMDNHSMGTVFEELVRKFNEENNEEAGEHWTPRDAVKLMANLIFLPVADKIESGSYLLYDGAAGTGGMLTVAEETLKKIGADHGKQVVTHLYGQEINPETYAICKADMLLKGEGENADHIVGGAEWSTLSHDAFPAREFDFMLSNPPYGKSWKKDLEQMGGKAMRDPRFRVTHNGEDLSLVTRSSDGQLLFLANMLSKMNDKTPLGILLPPVAEQGAILRRIAQDTASIDRTMSDAVREIELIREYRTRLVADVVTGKVDVHDTIAKPVEIIEPKPKANVHFRRSVFAAEIVHRLHNEPTFGHVKFEKLIFLCEKRCGVDTGSTYYRKAAGPYDNRALRSIDAQIKKQCWYEARKGDKGYRYVPLDKAGAHTRYFNRYFGHVRTRPAHLGYADQGHDQAIRAGGRDGRPRRGRRGLAAVHRGRQEGHYLDGAKVPVHPRRDRGRAPRAQFRDRHRRGPLQPGREDVGGAERGAVGGGRPRGHNQRRAPEADGRAEDAD
jgi:type I restriction-modification system DNA methylase subunit